MIRCYSYSLSPGKFSLRYLFFLFLSVTLNYSSLLIIICKSDSLVLCNSSHFHYCMDTLTLAASVALTTVCFAFSFISMYCWSKISILCLLMYIYLTVDGAREDSHLYAYGSTKPLRYDYDKLTFIDHNNRLNGYFLFVSNWQSRFMTYD